MRPRKSRSRRQQAQLTMDTKTAAPPPPPPPPPSLPPFGMAGYTRRSSAVLYSRWQLLKILCPFFSVFLLVIVFTSLGGFSFSPLKHSSKHDSHHQHNNASERETYGVYSFEIVNTFNHDPNAFTQGLVYAGNDTLYESTGLYGSSSVRRVRIQTGEVLKVRWMDNAYFGEGLTLLNQRLFQVAWRVTFGFIYDEISLEPLKKFKHPMKDGWGLTTDGHVIYGSDGTSTIYVMKPSTFAEERRFIVKDREKEIDLLNELEYVGDELWANVWMKDCIARISPKDGTVLGWILLHDLRKNLIAGNKFVDVLNGIAWDREHNKIYVTGKLWPKLYEIKVHPHSGDLKHRRDVWSTCNI